MKLVLGSEDRSFAEISSDVPELIINQFLYNRPKTMNIKNLKIKAAALTGGIPSHEPFLDFSKFFMSPNCCSGGYKAIKPLNLNKYE